MTSNFELRLATRVVALIAAMGVVSNCGSAGGTHPSPTPTVTSVALTGGGTSALAGATMQVTATATLSDGTARNVTAEAAWVSTNTSIATVSASGLVTFVAAGDVDVRATYQTVNGTVHFAVAAVTPRFRLSGVITDGGNQRGLDGALVEILSGADAGRSTHSDASGAYAVADVVSGSFTVRITKALYGAAERQVTLSADTTLNVAINLVLDFSGFYGTFTVALSVHQQNCETPVVPASSGQLVLTGNRDGGGFEARITERGTTRTYAGVMRSDGSFSGSGSGVIAGITSGPQPNRHDYSGTIGGRVTGATVDGAENILYGAPCPGKILELGFRGNR